MNTEFIKKLDLFERSESKEYRKLLSFEIKSLFEGMDQPEAEEFYGMGYVLYLLAEDYYDICEAHELFLQALERSPKHLIARLYSAHCYHDKAHSYKDEAQFSDALSEYQDVDTSQLREEFDIWRYVKLQEQIGHCLCKMGQAEAAELYFEEVMDFYKKVGFGELPEPSELYECLGEGHPFFAALKKMEHEYFSQS